jgi:hypothetical protein
MHSMPLLASMLAPKINKNKKAFCILRVRNELIHKDHAHPSCYRADQTILYMLLPTRIEQLLHSCVQDHRNCANRATSLNTTIKIKTNHHSNILHVASTAVQGHRVVP